MSQKELVLNYMKHNGGITQLQATNSIGCTRLAARIADLKAEAQTAYEVDHTRDEWMFLFHKNYRED